MPRFSSAENDSAAIMHDSDTALDPLLRLHDVGKIYRMGDVEVPVLHDINLEIAEEEFVVVVGPSGSGKSTLLNLIGGIDSPTTGEVWFDGQNISSLSDSELTEYRRRHIGFIFQFYNLVPTLTARENVLVSTEISDAPLDAVEALKLVGLSQRLEHFPSQLSGGEQQRVAIARAVAKNPNLLLCDEPTGALDLETGRMVLQALERLNREMRKTILIITHNSAIAQMAHRVIRLGERTVAESTFNDKPLPAAEISW